MQEQGKIRHIGLSEVTPAQIEEAQKIVPIVTVQNRYSLADRRHEKRSRGANTAASASCLGIRSPAASCSGRITLGETWLRSEPGTATWRRFAGWLLHRSPVMLPIPGTSRVAHLEEKLPRLNYTWGFLWTNGRRLTPWPSRYPAVLAASALGPLRR